jgi:hypothetical protein
MAPQSGPLQCAEKIIHHLIIRKLTIMNQLEDKTKDPVEQALEAMKNFNEFCDLAKESIKDQQAQVEDAKDAWRPISTAPTNERIILLMGDQPVFGYWCKQEYNTRPKPYWSCDKEILLGVGWCRANQPLFWMPSPAIAAQEGKK